MKYLFFTLIPVTFLGCAKIDKAILDKVATNPILEQQHKDAVPVGDGTGRVVIVDPVNPNNTIVTNLPPVDYEYTPKQPVANVTRGVAELVPVPGARLFGEGLIGLLAAYAGLRSRKYKKAAIDSVGAAHNFREALKKSDPDSESKIKNESKRQQKSNGTWTIVDSILKDFFK